MIRNLNQISGQIERDADVVIIGGGIAGLVLAERLSRRLRVLVLESGPLHPSVGPTELDIVELAGDPYRGPTEGRSRGLGGTSNKWGGALLPFQSYDFEARQDLDRPPWPVPYEAIAPYFREIEKLFGLAPGPYDRPVEGWLTSNNGDDAPFIARFAKWPSFARRNVAALLQRQLEQSTGPEIWLEATCSQFEFSSSQLRAVAAVGRGEGKLIATARHFVFAAGAIESTRLLQWALVQPNAPKAPADSPIGLYLHDHLSAPVAEIKTDRPVELNRLAGFRFDGSGMRSFRLELSKTAQRRHAIAGGFAHIAFESLRSSGFDALRDLMRSVQDRRPSFVAFLRALGDVPYLAEAAYWRLVRRQICWPRPARYHLQAVVEQRPNAANKISLTNTMDRFGVPRAKVEWRIQDADIASFRALVTCLDDFWRKGALPELGRLEWRESLDQIDALTLGDTTDVFHPGGTTRMGESRRSSVVDRNLAVWDVPNLSILSTATFPSGASANPTMTLLAFALRLADHLTSINLRAPER